MSEKILQSGDDKRSRRGAWYNAAGPPIICKYCNKNIIRSIENYITFPTNPIEQRYREEYAHLECYRIDIENEAYSQGLKSANFP